MNNNNNRYVFACTIYTPLWEQYKYAFDSPKQAGKFEVMKKYEIVGYKWITLEDAINQGYEYMEVSDNASLFGRGFV